MALLIGCGGAIPYKTSVFRHTVGPPEGSNNTGRWELFWTSVKEGKTYRLTAPPLEGRSMAWSPDGARLTFISDRDGNDEVYVMNADGSIR